MNQNVFSRSRSRLTLIYTCVMSVFFIILLVAMHRTIEWSISSEQATELLTTAQNVAKSQVYQEIYSNDDNPDSEEIMLHTHNNDRLFFYVFNDKGRLINFARASYNKEPFILDIMSEWNAPDNEVKLYSDDSKMPNTKILMTARTIIMPSGATQTIFIGKDVTTMYNGMEKATYALAVLGAISLVIATCIGYLLSGRAMIPLRQAYEKQRQFAADASHELRTPLAVVMASAELLKSDPSITSPFLKQVIDDVQDEVKKMTKLVSDLLSVARADDSINQLKIAKVDLASLIAQTVRIMTPFAEKKSLTLHADAPDKLELQADEQKLRQLILILVDNAIKYTPTGGTIIIKAKDIDRHNLALTVSDTGIGIAPENMDKIFDRFYRVDKARSRQMGGNGLGLAIAREIVNLHQGTITVESELDKGTTFTVNLKSKLS